MKPKYGFRGITEEGNVVHGGYFIDYFETDKETEYIIDENRKFHRIVDGSRGMKMRILDKEFYHGDIIEIAEPLVGEKLFRPKPPCNMLIVSMLWDKNILNLPKPTYAYDGQFEDIMDINVSGINVSDLDCNFRVTGYVDSERDTEARLYYPPRAFQLGVKSDTSITMVVIGLINKRIDIT